MMSGGMDPKHGPYGARQRDDLGERIENYSLYLVQKNEMQAQIARLRASEARMRKALEPFSKCLGAVDLCADNKDTKVSLWIGSNFVRDLTCADFRAAREALSSSPAAGVVAVPRELLTEAISWLELDIDRKARACGAMLREIQELFGVGKDCKPRPEIP